MVLFAGFFVEANLNHIIQRLGKGSSLATFVGGKKYPGLQDKLAWFYNEFVARVRRPDVRTANQHGIGKAVRRRFPGFAGLYRFRNDISHGVINKTGRSLVKAQRLRQQGTEMVAELFEILERRGHRIPRTTTYWQAIKS